MTPPDGLHTARGTEAGSALVLTLLALVLLGALGSALALVVETEVTVAATSGRAAEARYAAEAGLELAALELAAAGDWDAVAGGGWHSTLTDGPPSGTRALPAGERVDLDEETSFLRCAGAASCASAPTSPSSAGPDARADVRWKLLVYGPLEQLTGGAVPAAALYVAAWVTLEPPEPPEQPPSPFRRNGQVMQVQAVAYGPFGLRRAIRGQFTRAPPRGTAERSFPAPLELLSWREVSGTLP